MRSPVRASILPNCGGRVVTRVPTAKVIGARSGRRECPRTDLGMIIA